MLSQQKLLVNICFLRVSNFFYTVCMCFGISKKEILWETIIYGNFSRYCPFHRLTANVVFRVQTCGTEIAWYMYGLSLAVTSGNSTSRLQLRSKTVATT